MAFSLTIELPEDVGRALRSEFPALEDSAREAMAVEFFRQGRLNHFQLSRVLGLDRFQTDAVLKRHGVEEQSQTVEDVESDRATLRQLREKR
jgi:hypothetical protein